MLAIKNYENVDVIVIDNSEIQSGEENDMCVFDNQFSNSNRISDDIFEKENIKLLEVQIFLNLLEGFQMYGVVLLIHLH